MKRDESSLLDVNFEKISKVLHCIPPQGTMCPLWTFVFFESVRIGQPLRSLLLQLSSRILHVKQHLKDKSKQCLADWAIPLHKGFSQQCFKEIPDCFLPFPLWVTAL